jgi:hypothetical protein
VIQVFRSIDEIGRDCDTFAMNIRAGLVLVRPNPGGRIIAIGGCERPEITVEEAVRETFSPHVVGASFGKRPIISRVNFGPERLFGEA